MAITTMFFGSADNGTADGLTWANRKALVPSGVWNTAISGFNFTADSLVCMIEPATYTIPVITFSSTAPNAIGRLSFVSAPSGVRWVPPNPSWNCCQPLWDTSNMALWQTTVTILTSFFVDAYGLRIHNTGATHSVARWILDWCDLRNSYINGSSYAGYESEATNCHFMITATTNSAVFYIGSTVLFTNNRLVNNAGGGGQRAGILIGGLGRINNCCFINCNTAVYHSSSSSVHISVVRCTFVDIANAITDRGTTTNAGIIDKNVFHNGTTGLLVATNSKTKVLTDNLFNSITTPASGNDNWNNSGLNTIDTLSAANLFVDPTNGDYRIKHGSPYWGIGIGAGDGPSTIVPSYGYVF